MFLMEASVLLGASMTIIAARYRREAAECELNAKRAEKQADQEAWSRLAEDWTKLAQGEDLRAEYRQAATLR